MSGVLESMFALRSFFFCFLGSGVWFLFVFHLSFSGAEKRLPGIPKTLDDTGFGLKVTKLWGF